MGKDMPWYKQIFTTTGFWVTGVSILILLLILLTHQGRIVLKELAIAEHAANKIWSRYPTLDEVSTVFFRCNKGLDGFAEKAYYTTKQCELAAIYKAVELNQRDLAVAAFSEYWNSIENSVEEIEEPWPFRDIAMLSIRFLI